MIEKKIKTQDNGFTLLEVVIALSIFLIGILATMQMGLLSVRNVTSGNVITQATLLAQSRLEQIKNTANITTLNGSFPAEANVTPLDGNGVPVQGAASFNIIYTFTDPISTVIAGGNMPNCTTGANDGSGSCLAVVNVAWQRAGGGRGGGGQVVLHTLTHGKGI